MGRSYNHWSEAEVAALKDGVARFGVGSWQKIVNDYAVLRHRTGVQLKDKYRNMIKFRHLAGNEIGQAAAAPQQPQRRAAASRTAAQRTPPPGVAALETEAPAAVSAAQLQVQPHAAVLQAQKAQAQAVARGAAQPARSARQAASPPMTAQQRQAQLAAGQLAAHQRLHQAQAAVKPVQQGYVRQLATAALQRAAAAAAMDDAAASSVTGLSAVALQQAAQWQQQQAEMAQQMLLAARQVYLQAAEEVQQAQAAANAAAAAVLQEAETEADRAPLLPPADGHASVTLVRHSNRRKAALNRKRFLESDGGEEEAEGEPHSQPRSVQGGAAAPAVSQQGLADMKVEEGEEGTDDEQAGSRPPSAAGGRRRRVGAQKRLHEDTRFGIYDDRRYRAGEAPTDSAGLDQPAAQRRRVSSGSGGGGGGGGSGQRQRRRRRKPRHLSGEFALSDEEDEDFELDAEMAEAELAEADEAEEEWQRQARQEAAAHEVECVCGATYDDGDEMAECESCGTWAHMACLMRYGRLRHQADRYQCGRCQGFGSPMAAGTPTAAGALSPRGVAVALGARRQAFRAGGRTDSFNNDELYDIAAFLDGMGPQQRQRLERSTSRGSLAPSSARARSGSAQALAALSGLIGGGSGGGASGGSGSGGSGGGSDSDSLPAAEAPPVPRWGGSGPRQRRHARSISVQQAQQAQQQGQPGQQAPQQQQQQQQQGEAWPSAGVLQRAPRTRSLLPPQAPPHAAEAASEEAAADAIGATGMSLQAALAAWQQLPLATAAARLPHLLPQPHLQLPPSLPPFMPLGGSGSHSQLQHSPGLDASSLQQSAGMAAGSAAAAFGRDWDRVDGGDGGGAGGQGEGGSSHHGLDQQRRQQQAQQQQLLQEQAKAAAVAELMQIMQQGAMGLPAPRPSLPVAAASALLSSRQGTPLPAIDLMHRELHDVDLQDDLHSQDWLAAAASLARADSQPSFHTFPVGPLDGGPSQHLTSLGGSPSRPLSLPGAPLQPPLVGLQELQQHPHWLGALSTLQQHQESIAQQQQQQDDHQHGHELQQQRALGRADGALGGTAPQHLRPPLGAAGMALPPDSSLAAVHRRLQQLAEGAGAAAAAAEERGGSLGGSLGGGSRRQSGSMPGLDAAQQQDGFGRYRQGSLHSLQQLAPDLQVEGLQGLTPTASGRPDPLMTDDEGDVDGPHLLIQGGSPEQQEQHAVQKQEHQADQTQQDHG